MLKLQFKKRRCILDDLKIIFGFKNVPLIAAITEKDKMNKRRDEQNPR